MCIFCKFLKYFFGRSAPEKIPQGETPKPKYDHGFYDGQKVRFEAWPRNELQYGVIVAAYANRVVIKTGWGIFSEEHRINDSQTYHWQTITPITLKNDDFA